MADRKAYLIAKLVKKATAQRASEIENNPSYQIHTKPIFWIAGSSVAKFKVFGPTFPLMFLQEGTNY